MQKSFDKICTREKIICLCSMLSGSIAASAKCFTSASTSRAAFLRFSYDLSPSALCTRGGSADSIVRDLALVGEGTMLFLVDLVADLDGECKCTVELVILGLLGRCLDAC